MKHPNKDQLLTMAKKMNAKVEYVKAKWPYNYGDNQGIVITHDGKSAYFFFNDNGVMLERKLL